MAIFNGLAGVDSLGRETTVHGKYDFPIGCYHDDLTKEPVPWHWHEELEAAVVTEGETILHVENRQFRLKAGEGFFINTGCLHACDYVPSGCCRFHSMSFHARLVGGDPGSVFWSKYLNPLLQDPRLKCCVLRPETNWQKELLLKIEMTWDACREEKDGYEFSVRALLSQLLLGVYSHAEGTMKDVPGKTLRENRRIKEMMRYIQLHCSEEISVQDIAGSAGISKSECLRVFHSAIGMTPVKYLTFLRIQKAAHLLSDTDRKVIDIGIECGFQDMSYFARIFRREKGVTPSEYRKLAGKKCFTLPAGRAR